MLLAKKRIRRRDTAIRDGCRRDDDDVVSQSNDDPTSSQSSTIPLHVRKIDSNPTSLELCGVEVHFPFRPYPCQKDYMNKVMEALHRSENALLESPTGTGKTLCLLCATLAWQRDQARRLNNAPPTMTPHGNPTDDGSNNTPNRNRLPVIIYASRTHSQLSQVVSELRNTRYRPRHAVLGSREQMCVHPKVNGKLSSSKNAVTVPSSMSEINHGCNKLNKERKCKFRNNLDGFVALPTSQHSTNAEQHQPILDLEDLVKMGKSRSICPFYLTRSHHLENAELIFLPYNYLFDKDARSTTLSDVSWNNAIVIFDEAHNLESFASDAASFDLTSIDIAGCIQETTRAIGYLTTMPELAAESNVKIDNLIRLKSLFLRFETYLQNQVSLGSFAGEYMMEIFQKGMDVTFHNCSIFVSFVKQVSDLILEMQGSTGTPKLDFFTSCLKRVYGADTEGKCLARVRVYRVHVRNDNNNYGNSKGGRTVSFWCFAPSLAMQELQALRVRSILVTSGTLSPLPSYSLELGLKFPHTLENPHIIASHQILVRVIGKGVSSKQLCSNYQRRDNAEYLIELGNTLIALARIIPGGMLVFFPSYNVMETCIERWGGPLSTRSKNNNKNYANNNNKNSFFEARRKKRPSTGAGAQNKYSFPHTPSSYHNSSSSASSNNPWKRLLAQKAVVLEPKSTTDLKDAIAEFEKFLALPKSSGCILMGVCRGKISEGIDFSDEKCRAVIITGLPFAPYLDAKVQLKREFLDATRAANAIQPSGDGGFSSSRSKNNYNKSTTNKIENLSGAEWYMQQAHRAVNQAVGRVIRHRNDYGAVLLLDSRFAEPRNQNGLSKWIRPHILPDEGVGKAIGSLTKFFREAKNKENIRKMQEEQKLYKGKRSIPLAYDDTDSLIPPSSQEGEKLNDDLNFEVNMTKVAIIQTRNIKRDISRKSNNLGSSDTDQENNVNTTMSRGNENDDTHANGYIRPEQVITRMDLKEVPLSRKSTNISHAETIRNRYKSSSNVQKVPMKEDNSLNDMSNSKTLLNNSEQEKSITATNGATGLEAIYNISSRRSSSSTTRRLYNIQSDSSQESIKSKSLSNTIASAWSGLEQKARGQKALRQSQIKESFPRNRPTSLLLGSSDNIPVKSSDTNALNITTSSSNKNMKSQSDLARKFYDLARNTLNSEDLSNVLSALRAMKISEVSKDDEAYLKSVKDLISILVTYTDTTDGKNDAHKINSGCRLLEILYPMLPVKHRNLVEKIACKMKWEQSRFRKNCTALLSPQEHEKVVLIMFQIMMTDENNLSSERTLNQRNNTSKERSLSYLRKVHEIMPLLFKPKTNGNKVLFLESFYNLIPTSRCQDVKMMVNQFQAQNKVQKMKNDEEKKLGEGSINPDFFMKPVSKAIQLKESDDALINIEEKNNMEEALKKAEMKAKAQVQLVTELKRKNQHSNPTKPRLDSSQLSKKVLEPEKGAKIDKNTYSTSRHSKRAKMIATMTQQKHNATDKKFKSPESLDACLKRAMSEPLMKETPQLLRKSRSIKSNIPKEFLCVVCDSAPEKALLADCGHSACMNCWSEWLKRSQTCPVCRKPTNRENLSRMVFERKPGSNPVSLTQMCQSDDDSDDEDELEII